MKTPFPKTWASVEGSDFVIDPKSDIVDGPFGSNLKASQYTNTGVPIVRIQNVKRFNFIDKNIKFISNEKYEELQRHSFVSGDILITKLGDPLGLACEVPEKYRYGIIVADLVRLRPNIEICSKPFLIYLLNSEIVIKQIEKHVKGTTRPRINLGVIRGLALPLPPLAEQKKISEKLDVLLASVEIIKARLERIPEILKAFRQSVLTAAVSGKLTKDWRDALGDNKKISRSEILDARKLAWEKFELKKRLNNGEKILGEKWKKKYKEPAEILADHCFDIPDSWEWSNLGELSWSVKDGPHYSPKYTDSGIPFISGGNISSNGIDFSNCKYISSELHQELSKRCKPEVGDILYTKGGTTGIAYFNTEERDFSVWVHVAVLKIIPIINGFYLQNALNSQHCYDQSQKYTHGVGNQDLGLTRMVNITIPVPPLDEQIEIVRRVKELYAFANHIEQKNNSALEQVSSLTQSFLAKAFRGELTADWRDANPDLISGKNSAEALLEKIKNKREAINKQPKLKRPNINKRIGSHMSKQIIKVVEALKLAGEPLSGQQLLAAAGYPSDSSTEQLEQFFLDIRDSLVIEKSIVKLERSDDSQDWFALAKPPMNKAKN